MIIVRSTVAKWITVCMVRRFTICPQIAICGQLIVSCKSSCRTQNIHHSIGVRPLMCNWRYTVHRLENCSTGGGGGGMAGWGTTFKRFICDNKWKTSCGLIKINVTLVGGRGGGVAPPGQTLATAVVRLKVIDRSKDLNVCIFQYVDNGLSLSR